jgi:hypothetical protein
VPTSAAPTSATGKIAACGLAHLVAPHLQCKQQVEFALTTSSRSRAVAVLDAAHAKSRPGTSEPADLWLAPRANATNDTARSRELYD